MPGDVVVSAVASQQATVPHSKTVSGSTGLLGSFKWKGGWMQYNDCAQQKVKKNIHLLGMKQENYKAKK